MNMARREHKQRGAALIIALGMLAVFAALGTAYLGYMVLEQQRSQDYLAEVQARQLAERAVWAAVGELQTALTNGEAPALGAHDEQLLPLYRAVIEGTPEPWSRRDGWVRLAIEDESAKLNINHASPRVLQAMLGVDGDKARSIRSQVPRPGEAPGPEQRWFASVDGLVERGFLTAEALAQLEPRRGGLLTADSVADNLAPKAYLNVNTAPKEVLAAVFNPEAAERIVASRAQAPITDFAGLVQAAQADPTTFNLDLPADGSAPSELAFQSRSFRIACEAKARKEGESLAACRVEAVVVLSDTGVAKITYWKEMPAALADEEAPEPGSDTQQAVAES